MNWFLVLSSRELGEEWRLVGSQDPLRIRTLSPAAPGGDPGLGVQEPGCCCRGREGKGGTEPGRTGSITVWVTGTLECGVGASLTCPASLYSYLSCPASLHICFTLHVYSNIASLHQPFLLWSNLNHFHFLKVLTTFAFWMFWQLLNLAIYSVLKRALMSRKYFAK